MKLSLCLALLGCTAVAAHADLSYTQTTTTSFGGMMGSMGGTATKTAMKGNMARIETSVMGSKSIFVSRGDGSTIEIDPTSKTYAIMNGGPKTPGGPGQMPPGMAPSEVTVTVKKLGTENIRGVNAPHWRINMQTKIKTQTGTRNMDMGTEIWSSTTPYPKNLGAAAKRSLPLASMMNSKVKIKGDVKSMGAAYATVPLRMKILMNGQSFGTTETSNISTNTLPDSLFSPPAGYRKVSPEQFQKARQAAMMSKMNGMMKGMPGLPKGFKMPH